MNKNNYKETAYNRPFIKNRADPQIYRSESGMYYFTGSVPEYDRIILRQSASLSGLPFAKERTLWQKHETGPQSIHIWAPELHQLWGKWYIYYAAGDKADDAAAAVGQSFREPVPGRAGADGNAAPAARGDGENQDHQPV